LSIMKNGGQTVDCVSEMHRRILLENRSSKVSPSILVSLKNKFPLEISSSSQEKRSASSDTVKNRRVVCKIKWKSCLQENDSGMSKTSL
jgi:hypothetical protein